MKNSSNFSRDEFKYSAQLVYPIDRMILQRVDKRGWSPDWFIHWVCVLYSYIY